MNAVLHDTVNAAASSAPSLRRFRHCEGSRRPLYDRRACRRRFRHQSLFDQSRARRHLHGRAGRLLSSSARSLPSTCWRRRRFRPCGHRWPRAPGWCRGKGVRRVLLDGEIDGGAYGPAWLGRKGGQAARAPVRVDGGVAHRVCPRTALVGLLDAALADDTRCRVRHAEMLQLTLGDLAERADDTDEWGRCDV